MNIVDIIEKENLNENAPKINVGDTVKVFYKIKEGYKERIQGYEGVGVERTFPVHSPLIDHVDVIRKGSPRRAKLYYVRERTGKAAKIKADENK